MIKIRIGYCVKLTDRMRSFFIFLILLLSSCASTPPKTDSVSLTPVTYEQLKHWQHDNHQQALQAFLRSCEAYQSMEVSKSITGNVQIGQLQSICDDATNPVNNTQARVFFEQHFTPYRVTYQQQQEGLLTGYYQILLRGSREYSSDYAYPLYQRPEHMVQFDLKDFLPATESTTLVGMVQGNRLTPVPDRKNIEEKPISSPLLYVDNPVDAFFLHIQGSGKVQMQDGKVLGVGYHGKNGKPYTAIGALLHQDGHLTAQQMNAESIKEWLNNNPSLANQYMHQNESFIFFRLLDEAYHDPIGAMGVELTPKRSLAIDPSHIPLGLPVWLETHVPDTQNPSNIHPWHHLMIAQDTGSAIKGGIRGDIYFGAGREAELQASHMKHQGTFYVLLP